VGPAQRAILGFLVVAGVSFGVTEQRLRADVDDLGHRLVGIASEAAGQLDGAMHELVRTDADADKAPFITLRDTLRRVQDRHHHLLHGADIYTLRRTDTADRACAFGVMTNPSPFIGDPYDCIPEMDAVFEGRKARTGLYRSPNGVWVSGFAPLFGSEGRVVALVEVDRSAEHFASRRARGGLIALILGFLGGGAALALPGRMSFADGPRRVLRRLLLGRLATRIGLGSSAAVLLAVAVVGTLDHREARTYLLDSVTQRLLTAVEIGALGIDPDLHRRVAEAGDPESPEFIALRSHLRDVRAGARLAAPVYTMRREGELLRFVVMTNEIPFIGDPYELRDGHRRTFESGEPGTEGPYVDVHGTWMSAWAPVRDADGAVIAVLQADREMSTLLAVLANAALQRLLFALVGVGIAFLAAAAVGRSIAKPVARVAAAAAQVGEGRYEVDVPDQREDEVGDLARSVALMAKGLKERERLRDMFGKYMAGQVAQELLAGGDLTLKGEAREITVVMSDIRGYTALTEELGAVEIVALLNEYFTILVDAVIANEGVVDKFMGDAMLCWFGAPVHQADHAERAMRAARVMMEEAARWNRRRIDSGLVPVATGVGVASGHVVVGNIGSERRLEYTAIGDAVNLASRLCGKAEAGEILVSDSVRQAVTGVPFEDVGPVEVKGVSEPVLVSRLRIPVVAAEG
jgi:class 3 adenylate cyclase